jgi:hypothetical protein
MEMRSWDQCGINVQITQCKLLAEVEFGDKLINPMHCRSMRGGDTPIVALPSESMCQAWDISILTGLHVLHGGCDKLVTTMLYRLPPGYRMIEVLLDAEDWLEKMRPFKEDPFRAPHTVFERSYKLAQQVLFPRGQDLCCSPIHDPLHDFENDLQKCADATYASAEEWLTPFLKFPHAAGVHCMWRH